MPEGPEIRRAADRIGRVITGQVAESVFFAFPALKRFETELAGQQITAVDTRGKAMLTRFEQGLSIYSHNQLYGRWFTAAPGRKPNSRRSLRLALETPAGGAYLYSASSIEVLDDTGVALHPFLSKLGPDLLDPRLNAESLAERLQEPRFLGRSLAALYLDQHFLAGLGNYLRSEILFLSGLAPQRRPRELAVEQLMALASVTLQLGRRAYETRGITLDTEQLARLPKSRRRHRFWVFDREGQPCYRCARPIERETRGSRRLYRCGVCQP